MDCNDQEHAHAVKLGILSDEEIHKLEQALRKARQDVFSEDPAVEEKASADITLIMAKLEPMWRAWHLKIQKAAADAKMRLWE